MSIEAVSFQGANAMDSNKKKDIAKNITGQVLTLAGSTAAGVIGGSVADKFMHQGYNDSSSFVGKKVLEQFEEFFKGELNKQHSVNVPGVRVAVDEAGLKADLFKDFNKNFFKKFGYEIDKDTNKIAGSPFKKAGTKIMLGVAVASLLLYNGIKLIKNNQANK